MHEEAAEALHAGIESRHPDAASLEKEPISRLAGELGLRPTVFDRWHKECFKNGTAAFEQKGPCSHSADQERIAYLERKIQTKDEVLAEWMAQHVALEKTLGAL